MKKLIPLLIAILVFSSHDMYLKLDTYFLNSDTQSTIKLFNGTFDKSENVIDRNRMIDVSIVGNGVRTRVDSTLWSERDSMTLLSFKTGDPGTWVAGLSTYARNIEMDAEAFNGYLEHDGVIDMLEWRKENDALDQDAIEKYSKHVKTIFQVGDTKTDDWKIELGYPIEFIPLANPYNVHAGDQLKVKLLWQGAPLTDQLVTLDSDGSTHSHDHDHSHDENGDHDHESNSNDHHHGGTQVRTDSNGVLTVNLTNEGIWYLRTIHLIESDKPGLTHESNWATLTFEIGHSHGPDTHTHADEGIDGIPSYVFLLGSFALLGILFFYFNNKKK